MNKVAVNNTLGHDMIEARLFFGKKWNEMSRSERRDAVRYLKSKGIIGDEAPEQEADVYEASAMQYSSGGIERSSNPSLRPSPSISATVFEKGERRMGNDGNIWEIGIDSRGIHRWKRAGGNSLPSQHRQPNKKEDKDEEEVASLPFHSGGDVRYNTLVNKIPVSQNIDGRDIHEVMTTKEIADILGMSTNDTYKYLMSLGEDKALRYGYRVKGGWHDWESDGNPKAHSVGWQLYSEEKNNNMAYKKKAHGGVMVADMVSNCCGVKARNEFDEMAELCSSCGEHCAYIPEGSDLHNQYVCDECSALIGEGNPHYKVCSMYNPKYADGGKIQLRNAIKERLKKQTIESKVQEIVGSDWFLLDKASQERLVSDMVSEGVVFAKGGGVTEAKPQKVIYTLVGGKKVEKTYDSKEDMDEGISAFYIENDVEDISVTEEEVVKKKSLFDSSKAIPKKAAKGKEKPEVVVKGIESEIAEYKRLNGKKKMLEAEISLIGSKLKEIGKEHFMKMYLEKNRRPDNFNLADGDEDILFMVKDAYIKVETEKQAMLETYGEGLVETVITYEFDKDLVEKKVGNTTIGEIVSDLIINSKLIPEGDKEKLIISKSVTRIPKGTIERLTEYDNPQEVFELIQPNCSLM